MAFPVIAYSSMLHASTSTVTDPGTEVNYDYHSLFDYRVAPVWKSNTTVKPINIDIDCGASSTKDADYIALVNHNLFTLGATVKVMADTTPTPTTQRMAATAVTQNTVTYLPFTAPGVFRYWRIQITVAGASFASAPYIGDIFMGLKTTCPEYMTPEFDPYFDDVEISGSEASEGGHYLGSVARGHSHRGNIAFGEAGASRTALDAGLTTFISSHAVMRRPFFFILDTADSGTFTEFATAHYIKMPRDGRVSRRAVGGTWSRVTVTIPVEEAYMEPAA